MSTPQQDMGKYLQLLIKLGVSMLLSIFLGFGIGFFIESRFPKNGLFLLLGIGLGVGIGFMLLFREIKELGNSDDTNNQKR